MLIFSTPTREGLLLHEVVLQMFMSHWEGEEGAVGWSASLTESSFSALGTVTNGGALFVLAILPLEGLFPKSISKDSCFEFPFFLFIQLFVALDHVVYSSENLKLHSHFGSLRNCILLFS